ncbi:uncharacterized protein LOC111018559 [Momordica charantia]|uniref:Uncharacterized protein LOC111018559 n=1 Tax=Momordica charantia TaxID=3673 RepID=A0A6J1DAK7_MOMCH|nr:uncharacterized protein LOC111018559 [Momordica charantia]
MASVRSGKVLPDRSKLESLDGSNYHRWSQKLFIFFEQLEVDYVLTTAAADVAAVAEAVAGNVAGAVAGTVAGAARAVAGAVTGATTTTAVAAADKFKKDNKTIHEHLLNHMNNSLFDFFVTKKSAKIMWDTLESRYGGDDAGRKKYVVGKWLQFQMADDKSIMDQVHEYKNLVANVLSEGMKMCEILQTNLLLEKFPPFWSDYRNHLKHKKKDLTLQEMISHMRIEKANKQNDKLSSQLVNSVKANLIESSGVNKDRFKGKGKQVAQERVQKNKGFQFKSPDGRIEKIKDIVEANLVENKSDWVLDTRAYRHFCSNRNPFHEFHDSTDGEFVFMGNSATVEVLGKGKILLKLTFDKTLSLSDVLYVPSLRRNLISGSY